MVEDVFSKIESASINTFRKFLNGRWRNMAIVGLQIWSGKVKAREKSLKSRGIGKLKLSGNPE